MTSIPGDFDWQIYINLHEDLKKMTKKQAINHYIKHGINENRPYKKCEIDKNQECLINATEKQEINHYINQGINENKKRVIMIINETESKFCGGTKTALSYLFQFQQLGYLTDLFIMSFIGKKRNILHALPYLCRDEQKINVYFNIADVYETNYEFVISTYNYTCYYSTLLKSKKYIYFIQDFECDFFPKEDFNYCLAYNSYFISNQYHVILGNGYINNKLNEINSYNKVINIPLVADNLIYYNMNLDRKGKILFTYFKNKSRRLPELIKNIAKKIVNKYPNYKYFCFPDDIEIDNVKNYGFLKPEELNYIYNTCEIAFCMSDTNISRLSFEMLSTGIIVIETNKNNLDDCFVCCEINSDDILCKFELLINDNYYYSQKNLKIKNFNEKKYSENELFQQSIKELELYPSKNKQTIYFIGSNGFLGCDFLKSYVIRDKLNEYYNIVCLPSDINFMFNSNIFDFLSKITDSVILFIRSMVVYNNPDILYLLKFKNNNKIIFDHVDLFLEKKVFDKIMQYQLYIDIFFCNNKKQKKILSNYIDEEKIILLYHLWDERYLSLKTIDNVELKLGFCGCVKCIDLMLVNHEILVKKYNIQLLDCECWEYVNDKYDEYLLHNKNVNYFNWKTKSLNDKITFNYNIDVSIREPDSYETSFKTNLKISTAACLGHIIITTKEPSNIDLLSEDYPFYLNNTSVKEFDRIYNLLVNDYNNQKILWNKAHKLLNDLKNNTHINRISNIYIHTIENINLKNITKKYFFIGLNKTATTSISKITNLYTKLKCMHYVNYDLENYDVFCDEEEIKNYKKYFVNYNSLFILNIRDLYDWVVSSIKHMLYFHKINDKDYIKEEIKKRINYRINYHKDIIDFFTNCPEKLIIINISNNGWQDFLLQNVYKIKIYDNQILQIKENSIKDNIINNIFCHEEILNLTNNINILEELGDISKFANNIIK